MKRCTSLALLLLCANLTIGCASRPMFVGPPVSMPAQGTRFSAGASWAKPLDSSNVGVPQLDGAMHLAVSDAFDLAVRAWSLGGGIQGRAKISERSAGAAVDLMVAPLLGVSTVLDLKQEGSEKLLPPVDVEFLVTAPIVLGIGLGTSSLYGGGDPILHLRPDEFVMRLAGIVGFACPTSGGMQIAPEIVVEGPVAGGAQIRPEDGYPAGVQRHPWLATVVRFGVAFSF